MKHIASQTYKSIDKINPHVLKHENDMLFLRDTYFQNIAKIGQLDKEDPEYKELIRENKWIVKQADKVLAEFNSK